MYSNVFIENSAPAIRTINTISRTAFGIRLSRISSFGSGSLDRSSWTAPAGHICAQKTRPLKISKRIVFILHFLQEPSRRSTQDRVLSGSRVRLPPLAFLFLRFLITVTMRSDFSKNHSFPDFSPSPEECLEGQQELRHFSVHFFS